MTTTSAASQTAAVRRGGCFEIRETRGLGIELASGYAAVAPVSDT